MAVALTRGPRARLQHRRAARRPATSPTPSPRPRARAGLRSSCSSRATSRHGKIVTTAVYGGNLVAVDGNYDDVNRLVLRARGRPYGLGLRQRQPAAVLRRGLQDPGLRDRRAARLAAAATRSSSRSRPARCSPRSTRPSTSSPSSGWSRPRPYRIFGAQATGCSPVSPAFARRTATSSSRSSRTRSPSRWRSATRPTAPTRSTSCRRTGGAIDDVYRRRDRRRHPAAGPTEGIFAETAGGVTVGRAAEAARRAAGSIPTPRRCVLNTGDGLKTLDAVVPVAEPSATIAPSYAAFARRFADEQG